jgi:anti-sigma B factor antagonist
MTIDERRVGAVTILALRGRLVLDDGDDQLRAHVDALVTEGRLKVIADLTGIDYIDSAGVGVLIAKFLSLRRNGGDLRLLHPSPRASHVLETAHLLTIFPHFTTEDAALRSFEE